MSFQGNGDIIPLRSLLPLQVSKPHIPVEVNKQQIFEERIDRRRGTSKHKPKVKYNAEYWDYYEDKEK